MTPFPVPEDELNILAAGYVLGDLSSAEMVQFQQLLTTYPELSKTVASLQETLAMLPRGLPQQQPDSQVKTGLLAIAKVALAEATTEKATTAEAITAKATTKETTASAPNSTSPVPASLGASAMPDSAETALPAAPVSFFPPRWPRNRWRRQRMATVAAVLFGGCSLWLSHRVVVLQAQLTTTERWVEIALTQPASSPSILTVSPANRQWAQQWPGPTQLIQDHLASLMRAKGPVDIATSDPQSLLTQFSSFSQVPTLGAVEAQLLGGSRCQFGKTQGLRLTYQLPTEQSISVYQLDLSGEEFPMFPEAYVTLSDNNTNLLLWRQEDFLYALTAELPVSSLKTLAQAL